jgi:hypothetical protein
MRLEDAKDKAKRLIRMAEIMMLDDEYKQSMDFLFQAVDMVNICRDIETQDDRQSN